MPGVIGPNGRVGPLDGQQPNTPETQDEHLRNLNRPRDKDKDKDTRDREDAERRKKGEELAKQLVTAQGDERKKIIEEIKKIIASQVPNRVDGIGQFLGWLTHLFKLADFQGWIDTNTTATAWGHVVRACESSDKYITIDIELAGLAIEGLDGIGKFRQEGGKLYLRLEVEKSANKEVRARASSIHTCDWLMCEGKLMWDKDGFFEIHPTYVEKAPSAPMFPEFPNMPDKNRKIDSILDFYMEKGLPPGSHGSTGVQPPVIE